MNLKHLKGLFLTNQKLSQIVMKNTSWMGMANIISKLFKFIMIAFVARELGADLFGDANYIIVLSATCFVLSDIGLNLIIIRDYQNDTTCKKILLSTGFYTKLALVAINTGFAVICLFFIEAALSLAFIIFSIMNIIDSIKQFNITITRAILKQELESICFLIETILTSILGIILVFKFNSILALSAAYLMGSIASFIFITTKTIKYVLPFSNINTTQLKQLLLKMIPFTLSGFFVVALNSVDTLMIKWLLGASFVGFYHAGLKLIETILIFPGLFGMSIYPFTSKFQKDLSRLRKIIIDSTGIMCLIGVPITFGGILLAHPILVGIFSDIYTLGAQPFQVLLLTTFPLFVIFILNNALLSTNNEKICVQNTAISFSLNIIFNIILIPKYGITGAAIGTLIGRVTLFFLVIYHTKKLLQINTLFQKNIFKYLLLSLIMCITIYCLQMAISNVFILIFIGMISYIFMLILLKDPYLNKAKNLILTTSTK
jgi:O-antigen/teichoic acid export membrane protein